MPIFADYHRTIIGYHGTTRARALAIVSGEAAFVPANNAFDWLGHGIYFGEYAPRQAWEWAEKRHKGKEIAVLASMIRLGNCFDLLDARNARDLVELYGLYRDEVAATGARVL
jgi:hypothetical protein